MLTSIAVLGYGFVLPADVTTFALSEIGRDVTSAWYDTTGTSTDFESWLAAQELEHPADHFQVIVCGHPEQVLVSVVVRASMTGLRVGQHSFIDTDFDFAAGYRAAYGQDLARLRYALDSPETEIGWNLLTRS